VASEGAATTPGTADEALGSATPTPLMTKAATTAQRIRVDFNAADRP